MVQLHRYAPGQTWAATSWECQPRSVEARRQGSLVFVWFEVRKTTGRPGEGFAIAAREVGYIRPGESDSEVWERAVAEVFAYWRR